MKKKNLWILPVVIMFYFFSLQSCSDKSKDGVFEKESIMATMNKVAEWQIKHPRHAQNDWTNGAFYAGLYAAWETTKSPFIYDAMMDMGNDSTQWRPARRWYHADDIAICQTYLDLYKIEQKTAMIQPTIDTLAILLDNPYPTKGIQVIKWWWCDALFMAPPVLAKLANMTGERKYLQFNDTCYRQCYDLLYNKEERLFARDLNYVIKNDDKDRWEANGEKIFWSRGNGWVMGGLAKILQELPADYPERPFYENLFKEMAGRILSLQQEDGLWRASLLDPDSYPGGEVSGSGFFCYAFAWGVNNGLLDEATFLPAIKKCWTALNQCVNEEGRVGWVQPIGADPRKNFDENSWEVYGAGAFLLAGSEVIKLTVN